mgnify:CR=1 FL=1
MRRGLRRELSLSANSDTLAKAIGSPHRRRILVPMAFKPISNSTRELGPNSDRRFVKYYSEQSLSAATQQRFDGTSRVTLALRRELGLPTDNLDVVDIGCGAGSQALMWAERGHQVQGIDVSAPLIKIATKRAVELDASACFAVGDAGNLPIPDASVDVVLVSELLEHLGKWEPCVDEALRVLRPGGVVYLSTTNHLCPKQQEFTLLAYSWYPRLLKKYCEGLAITTHGHWVQFATFPAVHWFSFYQLRDYLSSRGVNALDRFDVMETGDSSLRRAIVSAIRNIRLVRYLGHVLTPYTLVVGYRQK